MLSSPSPIEYSLPKDSHVKLFIYNISGQRVDMLKNKQEKAGKHLVKWEASDMPSGIYFYTLKADEFTETRKMLLLK